ncbi:MAG: hypothetical protein Ct9H300mP32_0990 [Verrucomicrobiota bacterium]|nr:MAG: hypothetical protein Ct9H300mP32_0990 [Verrucomicrobiota bacterium]
MPDATTNPLNCQLLRIGANRGMFRARQVLRCNRFSICAVLAFFARKHESSSCQNRKRTPLPTAAAPPAICQPTRRQFFSRGAQSIAAIGVAVQSGAAVRAARHKPSGWLPTGLEQTRDMPVAGGLVYVAGDSAVAVLNPGVASRSANGICQGAMLPRGGQAAANRRPSRPGVALRSRRQDSSRGPSAWPRAPL